MKLKNITVDGMVLTKIDTDSLYDKDGIQGVNECYMKERVVKNPGVRTNSPWGTVSGCYRREAGRPGKIAFTVKTLDGNSVNWDIDSCTVQDPIYVLPGTKPHC